MKLFGSSGIRGMANKDVTVELALKLGHVLGKKYKNIVIGKDPRVSAEMIEYAMISGLTSSGGSVMRTGLVTTPTLAYAAKDYDCGVMITASHNPAEYIGIKLWNPDGMAFDSSQQEEIEQEIEDYKPKLVSWDNIGNINESTNAIQQHCEMIMDKTNPVTKPVKVVVDCGSGAGSTITPYLLRELGCEVITLNAQLDGHFPARKPEPNEKNLQLLKETVKSADADLGIAHDGDADRMMAVDKNGEFVSGDEMLAIFAMNVCGSDSTVIAPVDTSMILDDALDCEIKRTRVGDVYVAEEIKRTGADFGGEASGSWIFPKISYCPDGIYAAAKLVEIVQDRPLGELREQLPEYITKRETIACDNSEKDRVMDNVQNQLSQYGEINSIDGVRIDMDGGWVLVRPSGTEPKIRITVESRDDVEELYQLAEDTIKEVMD
ncbi:phosphoglucomutase/phosphomannomutase alpha/beta/alpha domain I (plasmid) [Methanohalobium evestigatum Z-7303]|uniref:Phosphoglucomutase/phosphomannomutase alpha/beta/alpha domain I n=1 Tax=Methanohalobium evestigatum (strain ATCC BAA-1072 / DSM 3721 / NBRC 107634 / OCM 161 / Z-7303) TaxID=644295 RepID=D7EBX1_METEZ|nr:phosphoglucosamine mutase [Methanohalobium evestigatum]ADI75093.1 phosphoglucomutase/phosphomannomutase alpha/beta/alpha domain I [Methanohalobium evestigatum Z-7303]